jgi:hypothetical protein
MDRTHVFLLIQPCQKLLTKVRKNLLQFHARIVRAHESFADEESLHLMIAHQLHILRGENAALGNHDTIMARLG